MRVIDTFRTVLSLAYSPCGRFVYSAGWQHVSRWDVYNEDELEVYRDPAATYLTDVVLSPTGNRIGWYDLARGQITFAETIPRRTSQPLIVPDRFARGPQPAHLFLADGTPVRHSGLATTDRTAERVAYTHAGQLSFATLPTSHRAGRYKECPDLLQVIVDEIGRPHPIGPERIAFASADLLWGNSRQTHYHLHLPNGEVRAFDTLDRPPLAVTPDGRTAIATSAREVHLIDLASGLTRERFNWDVGTVEAVAVAPDGMTAAVAGWAGGIALFDLDG